MHHQSKRTSETDPHGKANSAPCSGSVDKPNTVQVQVQMFPNNGSEDTVGYGTAKQTTHFLNQASSSTPTVGPATSRLDWLNGRWCTGQMNHIFSFINLMVVSRYFVNHASSCFPLLQQVMNSLVVVVLCFGGRFHGQLLDSKQS